LIAPLQPELSMAERSAVDVRIKEAVAQCNADKYGDGYATVARLARFVGHVEARKGIAPVL
jgi:hypothetical protein